MPLTWGKKEKQERLLERLDKEFINCARRSEHNPPFESLKNCSIKIKELNSEEIVFDLKGAEAPLANALRRIMISEIPTMAIEKVELWQNTSVIPDENLAHRVGLCPIMVDPNMFEDKDPETPHNEANSLRFKLHVVCTKKDPKMQTPLNINDVAEEERLFNHSNVYSGDLKWIPIGNQVARFK